MSDARGQSTARVVVAALGMLMLLTPLTAHAQDWRTVTSSRQRSSENTMRVDVEYAAGELKISRAPRGTLYRSTLRYDADVFKPKLDYADGRLRVGVEGNNVRGRNLKSGLLDLRLTPDVPLDMELKFGAVEANVDLGGLRIRNAQISTGASSTRLTVSERNVETCDLLEIKVGAAKFEGQKLGNLNAARMRVEGGVGEVSLDFTGTRRSSTEVEITMGLGSLVLRVPRGVGMRVEKGGLLATFDSQGLTKRGDLFYSEDYDGAATRINFKIDAALGSIRVVWVDS